MLLESEPIEKLFKSLEEIHNKARSILGRSLTAVEKNLYSHMLSLIHISEPTRQAEISYAVFCLKKSTTELDQY